MKALVFTAVSTVQVLDVAEPTPTDCEVIVDVRAAAICGSELHGVQSVGFRTPPLVMGHEFAGEVNGRRVAVNPLTSCGHCDLCERGQPTVCRTRRILGVHGPGGFAERAAVPADQLVDLPPNLDWQSAALIEPLANGLHVWGLLARDDVRTAAVIGAGPIGLMVLQSGAHLRPTVSLAASEPAGRRRNTASALGIAAVADHLVGEFDAVIDCVGTAATRAQSLEHLRPGGVAVWLGLASDQPGFAGNDLVRLEKHVRGSFAYTMDEFRVAAEVAGLLDLSWAQSFPLDEAEEVFTGLMRGQTDIVKAVLVP